METLKIVLGIIGGLGIFLFGIYHMSASLKKLAGSKLRMIIEKSTNTPLKGILVGFLITAIIQSSSGTTAIVVGLITAGLLTLPKALAIIIGANIGTTFTSILIGLDIGQYAAIPILLGAIMLLFFKKKLVVNLGNVIVGLGLLFFGLELMSDSLKVVLSEPWFTDSIHFIEKTPILGFLAGIGLTALVQSSSATIGIVQNMYNISGNITLMVAIPFILGANVGTTITGIFASLSGSRDAKRAALFHLLFNLIGSFIFMLALYPFVRMLEAMEKSLYFLNKSSIISFATVFFNLTVSLLLSWFIKYFVKFIEIIIPYSKKEKNISLENRLNQALIKTAPTLALAGARSLVTTMTDFIKELFSYTLLYIHTNDSKSLIRIRELEEVIDNYDSHLHDYLTKIPSSAIGELSSLEKTEYLDIIGDLERIGDHCTNIAELMEERHQNKLIFKDQSLTNIDLITKTIEKMIEESTKAFNENDENAARIVIDLEPTVDQMEKDMRKAEITLLSDGASTNRDLNFVDILSNLERIGDHTTNISENVLYHGQHEKIVKSNKK